MAGTEATRRGGLSLGFRIFLVTALLIVLAVGSAVIFTAIQAGRVAKEAGIEALAAGAAMQTAFQEQRFDQLELMSQLFLAEPSLIAYLAEAAESLDRTSILDLLQERQQDLGFDFAIILDPDGRVLARTDRPAAGSEDLSARPLVARALAEFEGAGVWRERGDLYFAVAVPIAQNFDLLGFLITGFALTDVEALESRRAGGTETIVLVADDEGLEAVASTLPPSITARLVDDLESRVELVEGVIGRGETVDRVEAAVDGEPWVARILPLADAEGGPVGATATLASLRRQLAPYRKIETVLLISGLVSVLLAFPLAFVFGRLLLRPLRGLASAANAAREGDYDAAIPTGTKGEVGQLAGAFDGLLRELREKRDMAQFVAQVSRNLPSGGAAAPEPPAEPVKKPVALLGLEYRDLASLPATAKEALVNLAGHLRRAGQAIESKGGRVEAIAGHRIWASFDTALPAIEAAATVLASHGHNSSGDEDATAPTAVVATGEAAVGAIAWKGARTPALVGAPIQRLEALARESLPGEILLAKETRDALAPLLEEARIEAPSRRSLLSPQPIYTLAPRSALRLGRREIGSAELTITVPGASGVDEGQPDVVLGVLWAGRYELLEVLGKGGMGLVYKAHDRELDDVVAVKILRREFWNQPSYLMRIRDELRLARKITHQNVLRTHDLGDVDGVPFISMEYLRGITLYHLLRQTDRLPFSAGLRVAGEICRGLQAVHEAGVIHRDLKPGNVILQSNGDAKLMDFGISRPVHRVEPGQTQSGLVVGTPNYLAPELLSGGEATIGTDVWAYGVVLYEIFSGAFPYEAVDQNRLIHKILRDDPTPMRQRWPDVPADLEAAVMTCLERDPEKRFQAAAQILDRLEAP